MKLINCLLNKMWTESEHWLGTVQWGGSMLNQIISIIAFSFYCITIHKKLGPTFSTISFIGTLFCIPRCIFFKIKSALTQKMFKSHSFIFGTFHSSCPPTQAQAPAVVEPILNLRQGATHMEQTWNNLDVQNLF